MTMSKQMEEDIKRWTAKRNSALVLDIIQGKTTVSEASRTYDLSPSEVSICSINHILVALK
jgi:transposase-like protein